ncbi:phosphatidylinositol transfer protein [Ordospora colligata]|nr:phosphatidylinositol transfer protein [Ordospora colligata]
MSKVEKIYVTVLPMTTDEYVDGQKHAISTMTELESLGGLKVEQIGNDTVVHETLGKSDRTHKVMHLKSKIPRILHSMIPEDAFVVEEISHNARTKCHTVYKNRYFSHDTFKMAFYTVNMDGHEIHENPFEYCVDLADTIEKVHIDLHCDPVDPLFDPSAYYHEESGRGRLVDGWISAYQSKGIPMMVSYKHLSVEVNNFMMGKWVSDEIEKSMRSMIASVQQRIFCTMHEWYKHSKHGRCE